MKLQAEFPEKLGFLFAPHRYKVARGGRGSAKSWGFARALLILGVKQKLRILATREVQRSIKDSVHALLSDQIQLLGLEAHYEVLSTEIRGRNGTQILFSGLSDLTVESIKSFEGVDICWCEEARSITERSWRILIPTIRRPNSEIWITFNPELDTDPSYVRFVQRPPKDCVSVEMNWRDNPWFAEPLISERLNALAEAERTGNHEDYENVWEGKIRSAVEGAIYHREIARMYEEQRVRPVPYDPLLKVHTVWDLGWNDMTSIILVQKLNSEVRVVGYIEDSHRTIDDYIGELQQMRMNWGTDWLPHDARAKDLRTGKSIEEIARKLGRNPQIVPEIGVEPGIKAARMALQRAYIDETKAIGLVNALKRYRRQVNQTTGEPGAPRHDEASHGADAWRMLSVIEGRMTNKGAADLPLKYQPTGIV